MKSIAFFLAISSAISISSVALAEDAPSDDAKAAQATVESFRDQMKAGKVDEAFAQIAPLKDAPKELVEKSKSKLERLAAPMKAGTRDMEVVTAKVDMDTAVVVVREVKPGAKPSKDLDPFYLVKQGDKWRIVPGLTRYDMKKFGLDIGLGEESLKRFAALEAWFKEHKATLVEQPK
jgi:hypothetical protein